MLIGKLLKRNSDYRHTFMEIKRLKFFFNKVFLPQIDKLVSGVFCQNNNNNKKIIITIMPQKRIIQFLQLKIRHRTMNKSSDYKIDSNFFLLFKRG